MSLLGLKDVCSFGDLEVDYKLIFMMGSCLFLPLVGIGQSLEVGVFRQRCYALLGCLRILGICCFLGCRRESGGEATLQNYGYRCLCEGGDAFGLFLSADENMEFQIIRPLLLSLAHQSPCISSLFT